MASLDNNTMMGNFSDHLHLLANTAQAALAKINSANCDHLLTAHNLHKATLYRLLSPTIILQCSPARIIMQASLRFTLILLSALLALIGQISGGPLYDICEWKDAVPEFHVWYREPECNPIWRPLPNGDCETGKGQPGLCSSLCLKRTIFHYGQEKPYDHVPPCRGPMKCSFSEKTTTGYNFKGKFSDSVKIATFNLGIPGGFNVKGGDSQSWKLEKTLKEGEWFVNCFSNFLHSSLTLVQWLLVIHPLRARKLWHLHRISC